MLSPLGMINDKYLGVSKLAIVQEGTKSSHNLSQE